MMLRQKGRKNDEERDMVMVMVMVALVMGENIEMMVIKSVGDSNGKNYNFLKKRKKNEKWKTLFTNEKR